MANKCLVAEYTVRHEWIGERKCEYQQPLPESADPDTVFSGGAYLEIKEAIEKKEKRKVCIISLRIESDENPVRAVVDFTCSVDGGVHHESMYFGSDWGLGRHEVESKTFRESVKSRLEEERGTVISINSVTVVEDKEPPI
ncbi:hypothetical protein JA116_08295 [Morganella morganii]|uniref:hypothetical protein n=1 Tax=Morganella morganii TaxID=582 RepID=UPI000BD04E32|nr:hypothetical protein [Morganella morganii]PCP71433.1 hypothetical protein CQA25_18725 [Morganella morganii]QXO44201.1 hypothetical protein CXB74_008395 [Morganella morganii]QXO47793.1 hypothetical protein JC862_08255 [Morganella morganii]QXO51582.1 hypothetical protein JC861_08355 [Morganella morganii]QXO55448.1 hypothetical protein JC830_08355 [Morganella morganii]